MKAIRDKAEALRLYTKQAKHGLEMQNQCAELKLRSERKGGELLPGIITKGGDPKSHAGTLERIGLNKNQSSRWQRIATPRTRAQAKKGDGRVSTHDRPPRHHRSVFAPATTRYAGPPVADAHHYATGTNRNGYGSASEVLDGLAAIEPDWHADALCKESFPGATWFPERGDDTRAAVAICNRCLVRAECLAVAVADRDLVGIWGGTSKRERDRLRRELPPHLRNNVRGECL